jgi:hypothetical protein
LRETPLLILLRILHAHQLALRICRAAAAHVARVRPAGCRQAVFGYHPHAVAGRHDKRFPAARLLHVKQAARFVEAVRAHLRRCREITLLPLVSFKILFDIRPVVINSLGAESVLRELRPQRIRFVGMAIFVQSIVFGGDAFIILMSFRQFQIAFVAIQDFVPARPAEARSRENLRCLRAAPLLLRFSRSPFRVVSGVAFQSGRYRGA